MTAAIARAEAGTTIFVRGGTYYYGQTVLLSQSGSASNRIIIINYNSEKPVFNFSAQAVASSNRGILLTGNYWTLKGLEICFAGDNGIKLEGNHNRIELCVFHHNNDTGLQLGFGHNFSDSHPGISSNDGSYCAYNDIINCDSYLNYDPPAKGGNADGFAAKMHQGLMNRFIGCRAWDNSDDAWDLFETDYPVYLIDCWAWGSGRASNFTVVGGSFQGNGNGIKLGGNGTGGSSKGKHEVWNCISFNNNRTSSVKGFDQNSHKGGTRLVNCLAWGNGYDYMFETASGEREFFNCVALGRIEIASGSIQGNNAIPNNPDEGWTNNVATAFSQADFNTLAETTAKASRKADGSLPDVFARLVAGSVLIDKGTVVINNNPEIAGLGLPKSYNGAAPDLGAFEY